MRASVLSDWDTHLKDLTDFLWFLSIALHSQRNELDFSRGKTGYQHSDKRSLSESDHICAGSVTSCSLYFVRAACENQMWFALCCYTQWVTEFDRMLILWGCVPLSFLSNLLLSGYLYFSYPSLNILFQGCAATLGSVQRRGLYCRLDTLCFVINVVKFKKVFHKTIRQ